MVEAHPTSRFRTKCILVINRYPEYSHFWLDIATLTTQSQQPLKESKIREIGRSMPDNVERIILVSLDFAIDRITSLSTI